MPYRAVLFALLVTIARLLVPGLASPDVAAADICGNQIGPTESGISCGVEARVTDSLAGEVFGGGADPTGAGTADPGLPDAPGAPTCPDDGCFVSGTLVVTAQGMVPIEDIEVGDRVATACEGETQSSETEVDPTTWRKVTLRIADVDGGVLEITALRPAQWLAVTGCVAGQQVWLEFPEMGAKGWALIDAVDACPPLGKGPGRVVLTTFRQLSNAIVRVWLDGPHEVVDATEGHPFWSVTHGEWRHAYQLVPGETLKTQSGSVTVLRVDELPGVFRIHNFEVEVEHVYCAGSQCVLSHNPRRRDFIGPMPNPLVPGPFATESIPAVRGADRHWTPAEQAKIDEIGRRDGCHTCGSTEGGKQGGSFVLDHQPVSALSPPGTPQRLYPQCLSCSRRQGGVTSRQ